MTKLFKTAVIYYTLTKLCSHPPFGLYTLSVRIDAGQRVKFVPCGKIINRHLLLSAFMSKDILPDFKKNGIVY